MCRSLVLDSNASDGGKVEGGDAPAIAHHNAEEEVAEDQLLFEALHDGGGVEEDDDAIRGEEEVDDDVGAAIATTDNVVVAPGAGEEAESHPIEAPIANDSNVVVEGEELAHALQQLEVVPIAEGDLEGQVEKVAVVSGVDGGKDKAATIWKSNFELLCAYKAEHGGSCDVSRNEEGHQRLGRWVKSVCVVNSLLCCLLTYHFLMEFTLIRCPCNCTTAAKSAEEEV